MKKIFLSASLLFASAAAFAQQGVSTFEDLTLSGPDTFYINTNMSGVDVGFDQGPLHFPYVYDTSFGGYWVSGWAYSNIKDSVTSGFGNLYAAKPNGGGIGSQQYIVSNNGYENYLTGTSPGVTFHPLGLQIANGTFAYNSMRDGDVFSRKFGDTTGTSSGLPQGEFPDFFLLTMRGYLNGQLSNTDSVYLADFRGPTNTDFILEGWQTVNLSSWNFAIDSITFSLSSSDIGDFGINTPLFFCLDNFAYEPSEAIPTFASASVKLYPVPASNILNIQITENGAKSLTLIDATGRTLETKTNPALNSQFSLINYPAGIYFLLVVTKDGTQTLRFSKQ